MLSDIYKNTEYTVHNKKFIKSKDFVDLFPGLDIEVIGRLFNIHLVKIEIDPIVKLIEGAFSGDWSKFHKSDLQYSTDEYHKQLEEFLSQNPLSSIVDMENEQIVTEAYLIKTANERICYFEFDIRMKRAVALVTHEQLIDPAFRIVKKAKYFCRLAKFVDSNQ